MPASPTEDESQVPAAHSPATLGLHRGRRVLGGFVLVGLLTWAGPIFVRELQQAAAPPPPEAVPAVAPTAKPAVAQRPAPAKRPIKPARIGSLRTPASVEPERALSAPPLVPAILEVAEVEPEPSALERDDLAPAAVQAELPVAAPEAARLVEDDPEPELEPVDDGNGEAIARAIAAQKRGAVQTCFERELKQTPTLTGTLIVELDLAPPHRVNGVRVADDLERPAFTQCIASTMEQLTFVALNEEVSVRVPYVLSARAK